MNTHMPSPDELLHAYIDHELDPQHEQQFFALLSTDGELRDRLRDLRSIRNEARRFTMSAPPPSTATEALFSRLGFAEQSVEAETEKKKKNRMAVIFPMEWSQAWSPLAAAASAAIITAIILLGMRDGAATAESPLLAVQQTAPEQNEAMLTTDSGTETLATPVRGTTVTPRGYSEQTAQPSPSSTVPADASSDAQQENPPREMHVDEETLPTAYASLTDTPPAVVPLPDELNEVVVTDAETQRSDQADFAVVPFTPTESPVIMAQRNTPSVDQGPAVDIRQYFPGLLSGDVTHGLSLELRGINATSFPGETISPKSDPWMQNMAIGVFYTGLQHDIGLEFGQEPFSQHYHGIEDGKAVRYQQNLMTPWLHATWRYRFEPIAMAGGIEPYIMAGVGSSTQLWPMAKSGAGIMYMPDRRVRFHIGIEGSLLAFPYQDNWFTSRRLGMSYGLSVLF